MEVTLKLLIMKKTQKIFNITAIILIIDQIIKIIIRSNLNEYQEIKIIKNFFSITLLKNTGAAFSILKNSTLLLIIISVLFILLISKYIKKEEKKLTKLDVYSYGIILGGIFGNLLDRIIHKGVIDYLSFRFLSYYFPVFNFADISITVGIALLIISTIINEKKQDKEGN